MATSETNKEGYVDLFVPKGYAGDDPNIIIGINGKIFLLPRGKTSQVPAYVKDEYERSLKAQETFDKTSEALLEKAAKPIN